ncbi:MAG: hypothetical protein KDA84_14305, partial [Planctomycetaceae bacterium]|nr:hypothetical protein [Planctomycetaceae bacterium]
LYSDIDLCLRIGQQGLRIVYTPHARLIHHEAATRKSRKEDEKDAHRFAELLETLEVKTDPYFHPLLSARSTIPQLNTPSGSTIAENLQYEIKKNNCQSNSNPLLKRAA